MNTPRSHRLANGVTVLCDPAPGFETLALSVVAGRGARSEDSARSGWSHFLEHMVFKGAGERSSREIVESIESAGGQINAATSYERTSFQVRALKGGLPLAIGVVGDLVLRPTLDPDDLEREKSVVAQEIAEAADTPDDHVFELAQSRAFSGQPLGRPILGSVESLAPIEPSSLAAWRADLYAPDRLVISASGAVDEDELLALTERHFAIDARDPSSDALAAADFIGGAVKQRRRLEQAHLVFLLPGPGVHDEASWALRLFAEILGGGMSSRLFQEAREKLGLAYAIDAYVDFYADASLLGVYAGCEAANAARLAQVAAAQILSLTRSAGGQELARAKAQLKGSLFMGRESLATRAEQGATQTLAYGRVLSAAEIGERIDAVTAEDIADLGARLLAPGRAVGCVLAPQPALGAATRFLEGLFG